MALYHRVPPATRLVPSIATLAALESALSSFTLSSTSQSTASSSPLQWKRHASHASQGRANGAKQGPGKRLGAKKTAGQYVVPGNILYKQRGTLWFPGDGCHMGRDHTIHAAVPGYVKYYRDPVRHPKRKFIGVVFQRDNVLPQPPNAARRRQLGMLAYQMPSTKEEFVAGDLTNLAASPPTSTTPPAADAGRLSTLPRERPQESRQTKVVKTRRDGKVVETKLTLRRGYQWRQANYEIGRAAFQSEKAMNVRPYDPKNRFAAWRKRTARLKANAERRSLGRGGKKKK